MKALDNIFKGCRYFTSILFVAVLLISGCSKQEMAPLANEGDLDQINLKSMPMINGEVCLNGTSNFDVYSPKLSKVIVDPADMFLIMEAKLKHIEGQYYLLTTTEYMPTENGPMLYRIFDFDVKISNGGVVKFTYPETWWELGEYRNDILGQFLDHTGCIAYGAGVNKGTICWKGSFDGENFFASANFMAKQVQDPIMDVYYGLDGPIKFEFSMTLSITECI
jgi:hypothetical protein